MKPTSLLFFVLLCAAPAAAQEKMRETPYYPLQVGNSWSYVMGEEKVGNVPFVLKVTKYEKIGDTLCARVEMQVDGKTNFVEHLSVAADGVYRVAQNDQKLDKPVCILKLPPKKGATWAIDSKGPERSLTGKVEGDVVDEVKLASGVTYKNVATAKGEFDANGLKGSFTYYFAEGVGMVKQEWKKGAEPAYVCELVKDGFKQEKK